MTEVERRDKMFNQLYQQTLTSFIKNEPFALMCVHIHVLCVQ